MPLAHCRRFRGRFSRLTEFILLRPSQALWRSSALRLGPPIICGRSKSGCSILPRSTNIASGSRNSFLPLVMPTWKLLAQVLDDMIDVDHQNGTGDFIHPARPACRSFDVCERRVFCQPSEGNVPQNILRVRACRSYDGPNQSHYLRHSVNNSCMMR